MTDSRAGRQIDKHGKPDSSTTSGTTSWPPSRPTSHPASSSATSTSTSRTACLKALPNNCDDCDRRTINRSNWATLQAQAAFGTTFDDRLNTAMDWNDGRLTDMILRDIESDMALADIATVVYPPEWAEPRALVVTVREFDNRLNTLTAVVERRRSQFPRTRHSTQSNRPDANQVSPKYQPHQVIRPRLKRVPQTPDQGPRCPKCLTKPSTRSPGWSIGSWTGVSRGLDPPHQHQPTQPQNSRTWQRRKQAPGSWPTPRDSTLPNGAQQFSFEGDWTVPKRDHVRVQAR